MKREYQDYLKDLIEAAEKIELFTAALTTENFKKDEKTIFAVIRALEVMGEAAKNIPQGIRAKYKNIPWRKIAGMRDKLIHEYFGVDTKVLWKTVKEDIPVITPLLKQLLKDIQ